jgi:hypothetical protein
MRRRLALVAFAAGVVLYRDAIMDDTFIHLQYARNLRAGGEIAFNPGEPSLGATSPLWMLLLAATGAGVTLARVLSVAAGAGAVLAFGALASRSISSPSWALAATVAWAGSLWLVRHAPNGMETTLAVCLALYALVLRARTTRARAIGSGAALAGAILVRPEIALLAPLLVLDDLRSSAGRARAAFWIPACAIPCMAWGIFAHQATGQILPDTLRAKSGGWNLDPATWMRVLRREGGILAWGHAVELAGIVVAAITSLRVVTFRDALSRAWRSPLAAYACFSILLVKLYAAIDLQVQPRYLLLVTPCLVLLGFKAWHATLGGRARAAAAICCASLAAGAFWGVLRVLPATRDFAAGVRLVLEPMAAEIERRGGERTLVATPDIGVIGYYSRARILDLGGLVQSELRDRTRAEGYDRMLETGSFLDFGRVEFVVDRSPRPERFAGRVTRDLAWRPLTTGAVHGLGISRPETYYYTLYLLEPATAWGSTNMPSDRAALTRPLGPDRVAIGLPARE